MAGGLRGQGMEEGEEEMIVFLGVKSYDYEGSETMCVGSSLEFAKMDLALKCCLGDDYICGDSWTVEEWDVDGDVRCVHPLSSSEIRDLIAAFRGNVAAFRNAPTNDDSRPR